jgi:hypothetical protein
LPHSEIAGSKVVDTSPTLFAVCRVLHRPKNPKASIVCFNLSCKTNKIG